MNKMFTLNNNMLEVTLPEGKTLSELVEIANKELEEMKESLYGLNVKLNGRIPVGVGMTIAHKLAHICKTTSIFSPMDKEYVKVIWH